MMFSKMFYFKRNLKEIKCCFSATITKYLFMCKQYLNIHVLYNASTIEQEVNRLLSF